MQFETISQNDLKTVIVIPARNEAAHIVQTIADLRQGNPTMPIWVFDGQSDDATADMVHNVACTDQNLRLFPNPDKSQAHALNLAAKLANTEGFEIIIRADAHARYPIGFATALTNLIYSTGAKSVVVPLCAIQTCEAPWQQANANLQRSWLGHGGAHHRKTGLSGWVAHGHHAAFQLNWFLQQGGYDTNLLACEDVVFDHNSIQQGGRIWLAADWPVSYLPRPTLRATARQMFRNGKARMQIAKHHQVVLGLRQYLPVFAFVSALFAPLYFLAPIFVLPALIYCVAVVVLAAAASRHRIGVQILRISTLAIAMHFAFACGLLSGVSRPADHLRKPTLA